MLLILRLLAGIVLLLAGRRLYWLFVAAIGFLAGLELAPRFLPQQPDLVIVIIAAVLGVAGALLAIVAQAARHRDRGLPGRRGGRRAAAAGARSRQ